MTQAEHPSVRVGPLEKAERTGLAAEVLSSMGAAGDFALFSTLARHPHLLRSWLPFARHLLVKGLLQPRDRELIILRTAYRCGAVYEWGHHASMARDAGLTADEISAVRTDDFAWQPRDRCLIGAADDLHDDSVIPEPRWRELTSFFDEPQLIEICMLVGQYHTVAFLVNSLGTPLDDSFVARDGLAQPD